MVPNEKGGSLGVLGVSAVEPGRSRPERAVQGAVLDSLGDVLGLELRSRFEVGDRACNFQDAVVGTRAKPLLSHGTFQKPLAVGR